MVIVKLDLRDTDTTPNLVGLSSVTVIVVLDQKNWRTTNHFRGAPPFTVIGQHRAVTQTVRQQALRLES